MHEFLGGEKIVDVDYLRAVRFFRDSRSAQCKRNAFKLFQVVSRLAAECSLFIRKGNLSNFGFSNRSITWTDRRRRKDVAIDIHSRKRINKSNSRKMRAV